MGAYRQMDSQGNYRRRILAGSELPAERGRTVAGRNLRWARFRDWTFVTALLPTPQSVMVRDDRVCQGYIPTDRDTVRLGSDFMGQT
jgi:hypothetical protein